MFGDSMEFLDSFGGKAFLHPHASEPNTPSPLRRLLEMYAEQNGQPVSRVRVPKGYVCDSVEDLEAAYKLINTKEVVLKPVELRLYIPIFYFTASPFLFFLSHGMSMFSMVIFSSLLSLRPYC